MLTKDNGGGRGMSQKMTIADGGGGCQPLKLADIMCEQPPTCVSVL